jgi:hypothetical protein
MSPGEWVCSSCPDEAPVVTERRSAMSTDRIVVRPGEGKSVWLGGLGVDFKLWGEDTTGQLKPRQVPHT